MAPLPTASPLAESPDEDHSSGPTVPATAHADIHALYAYWLSLRPAAGLLPGRQHFDPLDIPALLPDIWLIDVVHAPGGTRFRYRLQGTRLVHMVGSSWRGRWFDEVNADFPGSVTEVAFLQCIATGRPDWRRGKPLLKHSERFTELERLFLPLARDGAHADMLLAMTIFYDTDGMALRS